MVKSRWLQWTEHLARTGETRNAYRILVWGLLENVYLNDQEGDRRITLKWVVERESFLGSGSCISIVKPSGSTSIELVMF